MSENKTFDPLMQKDRVLHILLKGGKVRVLLASGTHLAQHARDIHQASDVAAVAMSRLLMATAMLGVMQKDDKTNVTVTLAGDGKGGRMVSVAHGPKVKIAVDYPQAELPASDVKDFVGTHGRMTVVKDMGLKEPYVGQIELVSGEIAEDFAQYFTQSEQQPSLVALGGLCKDGNVLSAGGIIVQPLPDCDEETIDQLDLRAMLFSTISRELAEESLEQMCERCFQGLEPQIVDETPITYACDCSRERMERALISLGKSELQEMIDDGHEETLTCHFCRREEKFSSSDLKALLDQAVNP